MRIVLRRGSGDPFELGFPIIVAVSLILLVVLGGIGSAVVSSRHSRPQSSSDSAVPKANYAVLPEMSLSMGGGGRSMDVKVRVELDPTVDPHVTDAYATRIADRLGDTIRQIDPERWDGAEGATLMKSTISSVVSREVRSIHVRDVLLDSMVVH